MLHNPVCAIREISYFGVPGGLPHIFRPLLLGPHVAVSLTDVVDRLSPLATLPACQWLWQWIRTDYAPAIARYGHYDPARGHAAPVGQELDVLERREGARELLNDLLPGLGDATLAAGTEEPGTDG